MFKLKPKKIFYACKVGETLGCRDCKHYNPYDPNWKCKGTTDIRDAVNFEYIGDNMWAEKEQKNELERRCKI